MLTMLSAYQTAVDLICCENVDANNRILLTSISFNFSEDVTEICVSAEIPFFLPCT